MSKVRFLLFLITLLFISCRQPLVQNLSEYQTINNNVKYLILSENDSGFELSVYFKTNDFYTEKINLIADAKNNFYDIAKLICARKGKKFGRIDDNSFIVNSDENQKASHAINWVNYSK